MLSIRTSANVAMDIPGSDVKKLSIIAMSTKSNASMVASAEAYPKPRQPYVIVPRASKDSFAKMT